MTPSKIAAVAAILLMAATGAQAATIVNLSADPNGPPNAGTSSPGYTYNPVNETFGPGTYAVTVVGKAGGGLYDAYAVYAPTASNLAYTDSNWSVNVAGAIQTKSTSTGRFDTAALALAAYEATAPIDFTLATTTNVAFYVDDTSYPYFADDSGGVSLAVNQVPEPASLALFGVGMTVLGLVRRRRNASAI